MRASLFLRYVLCPCPTLKIRLGPKELGSDFDFVPEECDLTDCDASSYLLRLAVEPCAGKKLFANNPRLMAACRTTKRVKQGLGAPDSGRILCERKV